MGWDLVGTRGVGALRSDEGLDPAAGGGNQGILPGGSGA